MAMTLISVITVNLNNCVGLSRTMDSVLTQVRDDFRVEFIIVDGASTDGSVELAKLRRSEVDHFFSEPDGGVYAAMNKGLNIARGEWAVFMNSGDCFASPGVLSEMMRSKNESSAEPWLIYGDNLGRNGLEPAAPLLRLRAGIIHACHQAMAFRICDLRYEERYRIYSDLDFVIQYYKRYASGAFRYVPMAFSCIEPSGISASFPREKRLEKFRIIYHRLGLNGVIYAMAVSIAMVARAKLARKK